MPGYLCDECENTVPAVRYCPDCNSPAMVDIVPEGGFEDQDLSQRFSQLAAEPTHESVSFDSLRSKHDSYLRPLGSYLQEDEQPEAITSVKKCVIESIDGSSWKISAGILGSGHTIITDERVLSLFPRDKEPQVVAVQFTDIVAVEAGSSWRSNKLVIEDFEGYQYEFTIADEQEKFESLTEIVQELNETVDTQNSIATKFLDKIDSEIEASENGESVLYGIAELFEQRSEKTRFDYAVAEASSLDELTENMAAASGFTTVNEEESNSESSTTLAAPTLSGGTLRQRISETARNADPKDVGKYSLGAIVGFGGAAMTAPFSTTAGIAALLAGGAATGVYASGNPDSIAGRIEPLELAMSAKTRGSQINSSPATAGHGTGAALGMAEYLSEMNHEGLDEDYAKWVSELDIDSIIEGQEMAAQRARESSEFHDPDQARILGGAVGLASGYADLNKDIDQVVDDDIMNEMLEESPDSES